MQKQVSRWNTRTLSASIATRRDILHVIAQINLQRIPDVVVAEDAVIEVDVLARCAGAGVVEATIKSL